MSKRPYNPQTPHVLRMLAGLYLLYLAWNIFVANNKCRMISTKAYC